MYRIASSESGAVDVLVGETSFLGVLWWVGAPVGLIRGRKPVSFRRSFSSIGCGLETVGLEPAGSNAPVSLLASINKRRSSFFADMFSDLLIL